MPGSGAPRADLLREAAARLAAAGLDEPRERAEILWCRAAGESRSELILAYQDPAPAGLMERYAHWVERHAAGEPIAYLEGSCGFFGHDFSVDARVLVPRADSEAVVECALELLPERSAGLVADLGTGSGCLLLSIVLARPGCLGLATDRSTAALQVAQKNARQLGCAGRISFLQADWLEGLRGPLTMIVSNPPYVLPGEDLGPGVQEFEPHAALFTPPGNALQAYERILSRARAVMAPGGTLLFEVGFGRADQVAALAARFGWLEIERRRDLGGVERALAFRALAAC